MRIKDKRGREKEREKEEGKERREKSGKVGETRRRESENNASEIEKYLIQLRRETAW